MGATYTRQSTYTEGDVIQAADTNDEFDQLLAAFAASTGHTHDGTTGEGGPISTMAGHGLTFGAGTAGTDITITFDGESNDGVLKWMEDEDYFEFSDDLLIASTEKIQFRDTAIFINSSTDGQLDIDADTEVEITAPTVDINASTAVLISNDLKLDSDAAVLGFGADNDVTLTHVADTGLLLNSTMAIQFNDASQFINAPSATILDINATDEIELNATLIDINGNVDVSGTLTVAGAVDFGDAALSNVGAVQLDSISGDADTNTSITFSGSDVITITTGGESQVTFNNGSILPTTDNDVDLGSSSFEFKDGYFDGTVHADAINFNGTAISATAAELNIMDGVTSTTAELNILDGVTATAAELNYSDTGSSVGTVVASKVVTVDSNKDVASFRNITLTGELDAGSLDISGDADIDGTLETDALSINGTAITSTAAELNIVDGDTSATSTTIADADRVVLNDNGTMVQVAVTDLAAYFDDEITAMPNLVTTAATTVGALNSGSITSGFGTIDTGSSTITTTGLISGGSLDIDNVLINGTTIGHTDDTDLITLANGVVTVAGEISATTLDIGGTNITSSAAELNILDGKTFVDEDDMSSNSATAIASQQSIKAYVDSVASGSSVSDSTANTNFPVVFHNESNGLLDDTGALRYNPSTGTLLAPNLVVAGTTTQVNTVTMEAANAVVFEGATADAHETTLTIVDPTADRTINLPNQSGTIPVLAAASNTAITSTPAELNILDGVTATTAELNILDGVTSTAAELNILDGVTSTAAELNVLDGITAVVGELNALDIGSTAVGTAVASKAVILDSNKDYTGIRNLTISGEIDAATGDFSGAVDVAGALTTAAITASGIIKTDDATEATSTTDGSLQTDGGLSVVKDAVIGDDLKLLSDASVIHFGADSEVTLTHVADVGLALKHTATADDKPIVLTLQTGETDMAANDVIGKLAFQAPDESTGTDAILVAAAVQAVSEGDFSSSNNATRLEFHTGASEAAAVKMTLNSTGGVKPVTYQETYDSLSAASTVDCNLLTANHFAVTLDQNTTFTFSNPPASGTSFAFTLIVTQHSTAVTLTWPGGVDWAGGSAPDAAGNNEVQAYGFITRDGGTTYYGFLGGTAIG